MKRSIFLILMISYGPFLIGQLCDADSLINRSITASETDPNIGTEFIEHQIYINTDCIQNDKLLLHLVGTFDNPANTTYFPTLAANNGFKAIILKYKNGTPALTACEDSNDPDCFLKYREEIIFGIEESPSVDVDFNNSIINRVQKLLLYLDNSHPSENWGSFLTNTEGIDWSNIVVSGHSQGGGHAAYIAKQFNVNRALMFASPNDYSAHFSAPADWVSSTSATPESNYFAFGNRFDNIGNFSNQFEIWSDLNLLIQADSVNVDHSICNYNNSNVLYTESSFSVTHNNMIIDNFTPFSSSTPTFTPVWEYMLGVCELINPTYQTEEANHHISIFPNPTSSKVQILAKEKIKKIELFTPSGVLLKTVRPFQKIYELEIDSYQGLLILNMTFENSNTKAFKTLVVY